MAFNASCVQCIYSMCNNKKKHSMNSTVKLFLDYPANELKNKKTSRTYISAIAVFLLKLRSLLHCLYVNNNKALELDYTILGLDNNKNSTSVNSVCDSMCAL